MVVASGEDARQNNAARTPAHHHTRHADNILFSPSEWSGRADMLLNKSNYNTMDQIQKVNF